MCFEYCVDTYLAAVDTSTVAKLVMPRPGNHGFRRPYSGVLTIPSSWTHRLTLLICKEHMCMYIYMYMYMHLS